MAWIGLLIEESEDNQRAHLFISVTFRSKEYLLSLASDRFREVAISNANILMASRVGIHNNKTFVHVPHTNPLFNLCLLIKATRNMSEFEHLRNELKDAVLNATNQIFKVHKD